MCAMNNILLDAKDVIKTHTTDVATFQGGNYGKIGYVYGSEAIYNRTVENLHTTKSEFSVENLNELLRWVSFTVIQTALHFLCRHS